MRYTVGAAARATGVSESRLRTWERRYGIPSPGRTATGRRLYDDDDLLVIQRMAALVDSGVPAAQAAEAIHGGERNGSPAPEDAAPAVVPHPLIARLIDATAAFDVTAIRATLRGGVAEIGWGELIESVIFPALVEIGDAWSRGDLSPAHEHLLSELVRMEVLAAVAGHDDAGPDHALVILACPEYEHHDLGLIALWLLLTEAGLRVRYLGANLPADSLVDASRALNPEAVCLSSTVAASVPALGQAARLLLRTRPAPHVFVGGPGLHDQPPGALGGVRLPSRIREAAATIVDGIRPVDRAG